jgi:dTDP-4-dehydrorhamnose 3,5-epimerase
MINTIAHTELHNLWNGKVIVDEIRQFRDDRGFLSELWRVDDNKINSSESSALVPQMSYWSVTNSLVLRGPHEHKDQCDWFVSWLNRMVYQLYNPRTDEMFHFVTDPSKIYRIKVDIGIIHSYRNLELRPITTGNFPTALFMGENKKAPIDEIRHEDKIGDDLLTYVVLGAGGRLGKAITEYLYKNMGYHMYHVIPIYEKMNCDADVAKLIAELTKTTPLICHPNNIKIINCAGLTNVQKMVTYTDEVEWCNVRLSRSLATHTKRVGAKLYQISTDYIFRENDSSVYTTSKKKMEEALKDTDAKIIRVANLFSLDPHDVHNIISKLKDKVKTGDVLMTDPAQYIFPTEVTALSEKIMEFIDDDNDIKEVGFFGDPMTVEELFLKLGGKSVTHIKSPIHFNVNKFIDTSYQVNCVKQLEQKINQ